MPPAWGSEAGEKGEERVGERSTGVGAGAGVENEVGVRVVTETPGLEGGFEASTHESLRRGGPPPL